MAPVITRQNLARPHNITLVPLPPYAPELNPIENVWEYLRGNKLAITVFDSYDDILDKSCNAWDILRSTTTTASLPSQPGLGLRSLLGPWYDSAPSRPAICCHGHFGAIWVSSGIA